MSLNTPLLQADAVTFQYHQDVVLDRVSFTIQEGEFVGIIGPNGSGKTTLLKIILGLLKPQQGEITMMGKTVTLGKHAQQIGYVPQKATQLEQRFPITVEEVVSLGLVTNSHLFKKLNAKDYKRVDLALERVGLIPFRHRLISQLSGGQQQRAYIAKSIVSNPKLLILDEPTVGIDIDSQERFYALLSELNKKNNLTIILVSHDIDVVVNEVSSVLCLNKTLIYHGNPKTFMKDEYMEKLYGKNRKFILHEH